MRTSPEPAASMPAPSGVSALFVVLAVVASLAMTCCLCVGNKVRLAYLSLLPAEEEVAKHSSQADEGEEAERNSNLFTVRASRSVAFFFTFRELHKRLALQLARSLTHPPLTLILVVLSSLLTVQMLYEMKPFGKKKSKSRGPSLDLGEDLDYDLALVDNDLMTVRTSVESPSLSRSSLTEAAVGGTGKGRSFDARSSHIRCLWKSCVSAYALGLLALVTVTTLVLTLWPHYPQYNVCSDEVDWTSIVKGMASMKTKASFQLLVSIYNPNVFEARLDYGSGTITHDGVNVGIIDFGQDIPFKGTSITDVLVTATFSPDKWELLGLTAEYYEGTLSFMIDADVTFTLPAISYTASPAWKNYLIHLSSDDWERSLCACQNWT